MRALPKDLKLGAREELCGLICPDCGGAVSVNGLTASPVSLLFVCRIGHSYSTTEFLAAKEQRLEERLWATLYAFEELATLLQELSHEQIEAGFVEHYGEDLRVRARSATENARRIREMLDGDRPLPLAPWTGAMVDHPRGDDHPPEGEAP